MLPILHFDGQRNLNMHFARKLSNLMDKIVTKKSLVVAASAMLVATIFGASARPTYAADEVDCNAVMNELYSGQHPKEVAKNLSISTSSVYRCKRHAQAAGKASTKTSLQARRGRDLTVPRAPAASSAAAASPAPTR
jgi:hypothetical protein